MARFRVAELPYQFSNSPRGSADYLVSKEITFGGYTTGVPGGSLVREIDALPQNLAGGMTGGDRMLHHGYAETYARHLVPFLEKRDIVLAEIGVLKGTGLALWCDLFPNGRVIGFDIDFSHFEENDLS